MRRRTRHKHIVKSKGESAASDPEHERSGNRGMPLRVVAGFRCHCSWMCMTLALSVRQPFAWAIFYIARELPVGDAQWRRNGPGGEYSGGSLPDAGTDLMSKITIDVATMDKSCSAHLRKPTPRSSPCGTSGPALSSSSPGGRRGSDAPEGIPRKWAKRAGGREGRSG
jgi:hypothetical protein